RKTIVSCRSAGLERPSQTVLRFVLQPESTPACSWTRTENIFLPQLSQSIVIQPSRHVCLAEMAEDALIILPIYRPNRIWLELIYQRYGLSCDNNLCARRC